MLESGRKRGEAGLAVVLLHGRERTKKEMLRLAAEIGLDGIRWLAPAAELGRWYPNRYMDPLAANEPYLSRALARCDAMMAEASEDGRLDASRLALIGFSQGACLAAEYLLRYPGRCGTAAVLTGSLMGPPQDWIRRAAGSLAGTQALVTGSDVDEWVSEDRVRETARTLEQLGAEVTLRIYPGRPHIVNSEELAETRSLLAKSLLERSL